MGNKQTYWFKRKRHGWGWVPVTKQAWITLALYVAALIISYMIIMYGTNDSILEISLKEIATLAVSFIMFTRMLFLVTYKHGPKPKWRWGSKPTDKKHEDF